MANALTNLNHTIITDAALEAFTALLTPLKAFGINVGPARAERGDKVKVLVVPAQDAATDFDPAVGYVMQDADASGVDVTINKHKVASWSLTDTEIATMPLLNLQAFGRAKGFQVAKAVLVDVFSLLTVANFGAVKVIGAAAGFDGDDVVDIGAECDLLSWPEMSRSLVLASAYHAALRKDNALQDARAYGVDSVIRKGTIPSLDTFESIFKSILIPGNAINLVGFAAMPDAILFANRYLEPQEGHNYIKAEPMTDESGFTLGYREWYSEDGGAKKAIIECNYGYLKGNGDAAKLLASA